MSRNTIDGPLNIVLKARFDRIRVASGPRGCRHAALGSHSSGIMSLFPGSATSKVSHVSGGGTAAAAAAAAAAESQMYESSNALTSIHGLSVVHWMFWHTQNGRGRRRFV